MGENWGYGEYEDDNGDYVYLYSHVQFGYQLPTENDESTYLGINFAVECPSDYFIDGAQIINWAKYTLHDNEGEEVEGESYAVACIITVGDPDATEVRFFEDVADIETMDDV